MEREARKSRKFEKRMEYKAEDEVLTPTPEPPDDEEGGDDKEEEEADQVA